MQFIRYLEQVLPSPSSQSIVFRTKLETEVIKDCLDQLEYQVVKDSEISKDDLVITSDETLSLFENKILIQARKLDSESHKVKNLNSVDWSLYGLSPAFV